MLDYHYVWPNARLFRACTGLSRNDFLKLLKDFRKIYLKVREEIALSKERLRAPGAGRIPKRFDKPAKLLFFLLFYVRVYPTFDIAQIIFELDGANLHRWFNLGLPILEATVKHKIPLPARKCRDLNDLFQKIPELSSHIVDATEQPINRPKRNQKKYYSGKKKMHTKKRQFLVTPKRKLIGISLTVEGKMHDKTLADDSLYLAHAPPCSVGMGDGAYKKIHLLGSGAKFITPNKKPAGKELSQQEKEQNKAISSVRVIAEHVIGHTKFFRIFSHKIRYRKNYDESISNVVGGLYNFKLGY